jgi:serine/threonine protein kinase
MKMYDVWSSAKYLYLVLEYVQGGELFDYLCGRGTRLPLLEAISIIKQVLAGVNYCHTFSICHRDLKPENILLTTETVGSSSKPTEIKRVKIADFGMSTLDTLNGLLRTSCGSPHYAAPEIVRGQTYSGATSDIWSCGVIFFALLTSRLPFDDPQVSNVLRKVRDGRFTVPEYVVGPTKDLLVRMLEVDIEKRITVSLLFPTIVLLLTFGINRCPKSLGTHCFRWTPQELHFLLRLRSMTSPFLSQQKTLTLTCCETYALFGESVVRSI